jgi:two-component system cell cycle response regulator DivK
MSAPQTVLIADDDPDQHVLAGLYLEHAGYSVLHAYDGWQAVEVARNRLPSLVLMDMRMPGLDGRSAFTELARDEATRGIPVVAVTADVLGWSESRSLREGFAGHVTKPCDLSKIREVVWRLIGPAESPAARIGVPFVAADIEAVF